VFQHYLVLYLASRPAIEIYETHVKIGEATFPWRHIRRLDRSAKVPLVVRLTLSDKSRILVVFPVILKPPVTWLRNLRRYAREALIDGVPYRQFWGKPPWRRPESTCPRRVTVVASR